MKFIYILRTTGRIKAFSSKEAMGLFVIKYLNLSIARGLDATAGKTYAGYSYKAIELDEPEEESDYPRWTKVDKNFFGDA